MSDSRHVGTDFEDLFGDFKFKFMVGLTRQPMYLYTGMLDTSPTRHFAYDMDTSPIGHFAYWTLRLLRGQFAHSV